MRVLVLSSGGKDSSYATWWSILRGWDVAGMVTVRVTGDDSMMFQLPTTALAGLQAASAGFGWLPVPLTGDEDTEMKILEDALMNIISGSRKQRSDTWSIEELESAQWPEGWSWPTNLRRLRSSEPIDAIVVGALRSDYQKTRIEQMCNRLGIKSFTPLWHHDAATHMHELVNHGHQIMITSVTTEGLGEEWLGRKLTTKDIDELNELSQVHRFNIDGEGGEFETAVIDAPWMNSPIQTQHTNHWTGRRGWVDIWSAELAS
ncbi:MAG: diphthine--ammonia ligase [Candidatus Thermoplasmatota archaeon]|nr:diphthine--ammonia ligase [Candidatus Thermoplasmatota archaeon]